MERFFQKDIVLKKSVTFRFVQKPSYNCALTKRVRTISNLNQSKTPKEQL